MNVSYSADVEIHLPFVIRGMPGSEDYNENTRQTIASRRPRQGRATIADQTSIRSESAPVMQTSLLHLYVYS